MKQIKNIFIITILLIAVNTLYANNYPTIKSSLSSKKVTVGESVRYKIVITGKNINEKDIKILLPKEREFFLPKVKKKKKKNEDDEVSSADFVPLYIINNIAKKDDSESSIYYLSVIVDIVYYRPGKYTLPEIEITDSQNIKIGYKIPELEVTAINKEGKFEEIEPPFALGGNYTRLILLIVGVILLTLLVVLLVLYLKRRSRLKKENVILKSAIELFREEILAMNGIDIITSGNIESYATSVSSVFRKFLSRLYDVDAVEMTTDEISKLLNEKLVGKKYDEIVDGVINSFYLWDLSKFAEFAPSQEVLLKNHKDIMKLAERLFKGGV